MVGRHGDTAVIVAYVGLGANVGDRETQIREAAELIGAQRLSSLIETEPWGLVDQPPFLNAAAEVETHMPARLFLDRLLAVERRLGRLRTGKRWGPRTIDLDLLLFGAETIDEPGLTVPHPYLLERAFALEPLFELSPDLEIPGNGTVSEALAGLQSGS
jgi:2-amino-4-hydroxy-6-hydroxymethyldihydropteridine diphosphokinase